MRRSSYCVFIALFFAISLATAQPVIKELGLPAGAFSGITRIDVDKNDQLWVASSSTASTTLGSTISVLQPPQSNLVFVGKVSGVLYEKLIVNSPTLNQAETSSFITQTGDGNSITIGADVDNIITVPNGKNITTYRDYEFKVSLSGGVTQICKDYTVLGKPLPATTSISGPAFDLAKNDYFVGTEGSASTIYAKISVSPNGVCNLTPKDGTTTTVIQTLVPKPDGSFLVQEVVSVDPINGLLSQIGVLKNGNISMLVSPNGLTNPRFTSVLGCNMALDWVQQKALISFSSKDGDHVLIYDLQTGTVEEIQVPYGKSALRGSWVAASVQNTNRQNVALYNRNTKAAYSFATSDTGISGIRGALDVAVTSWGTVFFIATDGSGTSRLFQVDYPGVTGFQKPTYTLAVDKTTIGPGEQVTFTWNSTNATFTSLDIGGLGSLPISGNITISLTDTQTFHGFAFGPGGFSDTIALTVIVKPKTPVPTFDASAVVNAASFKAPIAPGSLATIYGANLATGTMENKDPLAIPTTLSGTQVFINNIASPLIYVSPGQINFQIPFETAGTTATVKVTCPLGTSTIVTVPLALDAPGIFLGANGNAIVQDMRGQSVDFSNPATAEDVVVLYATGLGSTDCGNIQLGQPSPPPPVLCSTLGTPEVTVGNQKAKVLFSGLTPGFAGLYQINLQIPGTRPTNMGNVQVNPVVITVSTNQKKWDDSAFIAIAQ